MALQLFGAGQLADEQLGIVNEDGQVGGADVNLFTLVLEGDEGGILAVNATVQTGKGFFAHEESFQNGSNLSEMIPQPGGGLFVQGQ
jgi:hypothetical protein